MPNIEYGPGQNPSDIQEIIHNSVGLPEEKDLRKEKLAAYADKFSFEIFPQKKAIGELACLPPKTKVSIACSSKKGFDGLKAVLDFADQVKEKKLYAIPHITARLIADDKQAREIGERLKSQNPETQKSGEIFCLAGDSERPAGKYVSSIDLLRELHGMGFRYDKVYVAGYPEGHPVIRDDVLLSALKGKQEFAYETDTKMQIVTQLSFNPDRIIEWIEMIRAEGINLPVKVGIPGQVSVEKLLKFMIELGIDTSLKFLRYCNIKYGRLLANYKAEELPLEIIDQAEQSGQNLISGFQIYTFNSIEESANWQKKISGRSK